MPPTQAPPGFVTIGHGIYVSLASTTASAAPRPQPDDSGPNVILIFGWMGASTRNLQHYSLKYAELHPHATQIVVKCPPSFFWTSARGQQTRLLPVVEALESLGFLPSVHNPTWESTRVRPRVLIHSFSNGGGLQLTSLGRLLSIKYPPMPASEHFLSALILDSAPAIGSFRSIALAFRIAIRNPVVRYIALLFIYIMHAASLTVQSLFGMETLGTRFPKELLNPRLLPWMNSQTPRLYVFSKKDKMVPWQGIQKHANDAKRLGLSIRCDLYEESAHVAHMRHDPQRYWGAVQELWAVACRGNQEQAIQTP